MQPKWFRRLDVAVGHAVWVANGTEVAGGFVMGIDNDGHYTVQTDACVEVRGVRRNCLCLKWQVGSSLCAAAASVPSSDARVDNERRRRSNGAAADESPRTEGSTSMPTTEHVKRLAATDRSRVDDTALLFQRGVRLAAGAMHALRGGGLTDDDAKQLPRCFHGLRVTC